MINIQKALLIVVCYTLSVSPTFAREILDETSVKASIIASFVAFTSWPINPSNAKETEFLLCIAGDDPYSRIFKQAPKSGFGGRSLVVYPLPKNIRDNDLAGCHVLIIRQNNKENAADLLKIVSDLPILTISEFENYDNQMSMINMARKKGRIIFSINIAPSNRVGIQFRSKLLRLAKKVTGGES